MGIDEEENSEEKEKKKSNKRDPLPQQQYESRCKRIHRPLKLESATGEQLDVLISCFATPNTKPLERANTEFSSDP